MAKNDWFRVDKEGLAQVYERRGPAAPFHELISNAWDEVGVTEVTLTVTAVPGQAKVEVNCTDNSTLGFVDLEEARVLFAPSKKKTNAEVRGRFNIGEKLFLSLCEQAVIVSTGGRLVFDRSGRVIKGQLKRERGTEIEAVMRMTRAKALEAFTELGAIISPKGIDTFIEFVGFYGHGDDGDDGPDIQRHERFACDGGQIEFQARLQSELAGDDGVLRPTERNTDVYVFVRTPPELSDREAILYEMGIPVTFITGPFDINVMQKVPLTVDRDNVKPAFLRRVRAHVLNHGFARIKTEDSANESWVTEAMGSKTPTPTAEALEHIMDLRFGKKRVAYDPSDIEGSQMAMSQGFTVVSGGSLPRDVWSNVRSSGTILPAGQVTPSKADKSAPSEHVDPATVKGGPEVIAAYKRIARLLLGRNVKVVILKSRATVLADYGSQKIRLNLQQLGREWFAKAVKDGFLSEQHVELLVHELGHEFASSHLDEGYHKSQTRLGVKLAFLAVSMGGGIFTLGSEVAAS